MTDLMAVADELYSLPPGEFTSTRNGRARQIKAEGDKDLAGRVQQLRKPSLAAWTVNMLVRQDPDEIARVLELGESLREAQANLDGEALRELTRQRRQLIAAMTVKARRLAAELGEKVSEQVAHQVEDTLHAAMVDEQAAAAVRSGLLTEPLSSTGLGTLDISDAVADEQALGRTDRPAAARHPGAGGAGAGGAGAGGAGAGGAGAGGAGTRADLKAVPEPEPSEADREEERRQAREEAQAAVEQARAAADKAARRLEKTTRRAEKLSARRLQLQARMEELRRELAETEHRQETLDDEIEEAEDKRDRAENRHRKAVRAVEQAESALADLGP